MTTATSNSSPLGNYQRTIVVSAVLAILLVFSFTGMRHATWLKLYEFFLWMETTPFGVIGKTWGAAFAVVEAFHLLAMAVLGGAVFITDFRLLGWAFREIPAHEIMDRAHKVFVWALAVVLATGIFMACGVAGKIYWLPVFWFKMLALGIGILFVFYVKNPLLRGDPDAMNPLVVRLVAISSILVWVTVAATGRWIGFAGS